MSSTGIEKSNPLERLLRHLSTRPSDILWAGLLVSLTYKYSFESTLQAKLVSCVEGLYVVCVVSVHTVIIFILRRYTIDLFAYEGHGCRYEKNQWHFKKFTFYAQKFPKERAQGSDTP